MGTASPTSPLKTINHKALNPQSDPSPKQQQLDLAHPNTPDIGYLEKHGMTSGDMMGFKVIKDWCLKKQAVLNVTKFRSQR